MLDRSNKGTSKRLCNCWLFLLVACMAIGCSSSDDRDDHAALGQLRLPLTTTSWGSIYRLRGVFVIRAGTDTGGPSVAALSTESNPDATVLSTWLAPGTYSVLLSQGCWLEASLDAGWSTVSAELVGDNPLIAEITQGGASEVTFQILAHGAAREQQGELTIGIDVEKESICGNRVLEPAETCDDGANNGDVGRCDTSCQFVCTGACPLRVDPGAAPGGSGTSWDEPFGDIQAAIDQQSALGGGAVWVLGGEFTPPVQDNQLLLTFRSNVSLLGGFVGTETAPEQRNPSAPLTTLRDQREDSLQYSFGSVGQSNVLVDAIHLIPATRLLNVEGGSQLLFRNVALDGPLSYPHDGSISSAKVRFEQSSLVSAWTIVDSDVAFVESELIWTYFPELSARSSRVLLDRVKSGPALKVQNDSDLLVKDTTLRWTFERGGLIEAYNEPYDHPAPLSRITVMDTALVETGGGRTPINGGSVLVWNSTFANLSSGSMGGSSPHAAAIPSDALEVALSTFFNNQCPFNADGSCWFDITTSSTSLVHNSLFALAALEPMGLPNNPDLPNPIAGSPRVAGNCVTPERDRFLVEEAQVLALQHPCLDGGDPAELEASRQRLLTRVALFLNPPFDVDVSRYQDPDWWKHETVLAPQCTDEAAPDPGRHYEIDCALRISEPVIGCTGQDWPTTAAFETLEADPELANPSLSHSAALDVSADGRVAIGTSETANNSNGALIAPALWEGSTLRLLKGVDHATMAINCDGSVAVVSEATVPEHNPVRWTRDSVTPLPKPSDQSAFVRAVSANGLVVVGTQSLGVTDDFANRVAVRWDGNDLSLVPFTGSVNAIGMSADGLAVYAQRQCGLSDPNCVQDVLRWTDASGEQTLFSGAASFAVSSDGSTVATNEDSTLTSVVIWNETRGTHVIPCPVQKCFVMDLSSRGRVLLLGAFRSEGLGLTDESTWVWTLRHGARELGPLLRQYGASVDESLVISATGMSDDARVFVGRIDSRFNTTAFRATMPKAAYE